MRKNIQRDEKNSNLRRSRFHLKDPMSFLTHFIAFIAAAACMPRLLLHFRRANADRKILLSLVVFMLSMILLYGASSLYHALDISESTNKILRKIDHSMIFVFIAGSYTPICAAVLSGSFGQKLLYGIWVIALLGIILKVFWITCPKWFSSVIYIAMGWLCIVALPQIRQNLPQAGFVWLLAGGILYTAGGIIYALRFKALNQRFQHFGSHEIFHLFVMAASACHFVLMYHYLPLSSGS